MRADHPVLPSQQDRTRRCRARQDPFVEIWRESVPVLQTIPHLRTTTILASCSTAISAATAIGCCARCSGASSWRATEGPERAHLPSGAPAPGRQALSDFTNGGGLAVTIAGAPFPHLLYHFWLAFSGWQYVKAICGGESFTALTEVFRKRFGSLAACRTNIAPTGSRRPTAISRARRTRRRATPSSAATTAWSRRISRRKLFPQAGNSSSP